MKRSGPTNDRQERSAEEIRGQPRRAVRAAVRRGGAEGRVPGGAGQRLAAATTASKAKVVARHGRHPEALAASNPARPILSADGAGRVIDPCKLCPNDPAPRPRRTALRSRRRRGRISSPRCLDRASASRLLVGSWRMDRLENQDINPYTVPGLLPGSARHRHDPARRAPAAAQPGGAARSTRCAARDAQCPMARAQAPADRARRCASPSASVLVGHGLPFWLAAAIFVIGLDPRSLQYPQRRAERRRSRAASPRRSPSASVRDLPSRSCSRSSSWCACPDRRSGEASRAAMLQGLDRPRSRLSQLSQPGVARLRPGRRAARHHRRHACRACRRRCASRC